MAFSTAFLATVQTFLRLPKKPLACFNTFFLRALLATEFTDLGIIFLFFVEGVPNLIKGTYWPYSKVIKIFLT
jgi:hypothetical protein